MECDRTLQEYLQFGGPGALLSRPGQPDHEYHHGSSEPSISIRVSHAAEREDHTGIESVFRIQVADRDDHVSLQRLEILHPNNHRHHIHLRHPPLPREVVH